MHLQMVNLAIKRSMIKVTGNENVWFLAHRPYLTRKVNRFTSNKHQNNPQPIPYNTLYQWKCTIIPIFLVVGNRFFLRTAQNWAPLLNFALYADNTSGIVLRDCQKIRGFRWNFLLECAKVFDRGLHSNSTANCTCLCHFVEACLIFSNFFSRTR